MRGLTYAAGEILVFMLAATLVGYVLGRLRTRLQMPDRKRDEPERSQLSPLAWSQVFAVDAPLDQAVDVEIDHAGSAPEVLPRVAALPVGAGSETPGVQTTHRGEEVVALVSEVDRQKDMIERLERVVEETKEASVVLAERDARIVDLEAALTAFGEDAPAMPVYTSASSGSGVYADLRIDLEIRV